MGAWSAESFGNDDACDFAGEVAGSSDMLVVETALDVVIENGNAYLEAPEGSRAIAAAEVVARLHGNWGLRDSHSGPVDRWVESAKLIPSADIALKAGRALDRVLSDPSELLELWGGSKDWLAAVDDLRNRLEV
jgi:hypothetical protein